MRISIIIRTLNEKDRLLELLVALALQDYPYRPEIIVVDNQSTDGTDVLVRSSGAKLVLISREDFSFPRSLNAGAEAATGEILVFTVGHARPFNSEWLRRGVEHFCDPIVAGVYSPVIPQKGCSLAEMIYYWPGYLLAKARSPFRVRKVGTGVFGATNIALRRNLWQEHHFDERFGLGGEDGEWAAWVLSQGLQIVCDTRFSVRHSHGLGFSGLKRQLAYWANLGQPTKFDRKKLWFRRDLKF